MAPRSHIFAIGAEGIVTDREQKKNLQCGCIWCNFFKSRRVKVQRIVWVQKIHDDDDDDDDDGNDDELKCDCTHDPPPVWGRPSGFNNAPDPPPLMPTLPLTDTFCFFFILHHLCLVVRQLSVTAAISAEEQQPVWQKVPSTVPWRAQMSMQVGHPFVSLGADSFIGEAASATARISLFLLVAAGLFVFEVSVSIATQCLSFCPVLYPFTVPVRY